LFQSKVQMGSFGVTPITNETLEDVIIDPYGWMIFGVFRGPQGFVIRTEELEQELLYRRTFEFSPGFKPKSEFKRVSAEDVFVLGTIGQGSTVQSELYQLDLTPR